MKTVFGIKRESGEHDMTVLMDHCGTVRPPRLTAVTGL